MRAKSLPTWLAASCCLVLLGLLGLLGLPARAADVTNARDHRLFPRLPGYEISYFENNFGNLEVPSGPQSWLTLQGRRLLLDYALPEGAPLPGEQSIINYYANLVMSLGGVMVYQMSPGGVAQAQGVYRLLRGGQETWLWVQPHEQGQGYRLIVLEVGQAPQEVTRDEIMGALERDGRVALYLNFGPRRAALRSEDLAVLAKVAETMRHNPGLLLCVEGHTDDRDDPQRNLQLSLLRAQAVVAALVRAGVDPNRLCARGWGQERPLVSNDDPEGRAQNRRIELVRQ